MRCQKDIAPDNTILRPIAFASKSLASADCRYNNTEREALGILHGLEKFHHYCFAREVSIIIYNNSHLITADPVHPPQDISIQDQNTIQAGARNFYCRLAVQTEPHRKTKMQQYVAWTSG